MLMAPEEMVATCRMGEPRTADGVSERTLEMRAADGYGLARGTLWEPASGAPRAVVVLCLGLVGHGTLHGALARTLVARGMAVVAVDLPGHGRSVMNPRDLGATDVDHGGKEGAIQMVNTLAAARLVAEGRWEATPLFILAHSAGAAVARTYVQRDGAGLAGLVLMGCGLQSGPALATARLITAARIRLHGPDHRVAGWGALGRGRLERAFANEEDGGLGWVSRDGAVRESLAAEPALSTPLTLSTLWALIDLASLAQDPARTALVPKDLPVLILSGADDALGDFGVGPALVADAYLQAGLESVEYVLFPRMRHDLLLDVDSDVVLDALVAWLDDHDA